MTNMKTKILHTEERYSRVAVRAKLSVEVEQKKRLGAWGRRVLVLDGATLYAYKVKGEGGSVGGWAVGGADVHVGKSNDEGRHLLVISRPPAYKLTFSFTTTYEQARMIQALSSSGATVTGLEAIMLLKNLRKRQQKEEKEAEEEERKRMTMEEGLILQTLPNPADLLRGGGGGGGGGGGEEKEEEEKREVSKVHISKEEEEKQSMEEGDRVQQVEKKEEEEEEEEEEEISEAIYNFKAFNNIFSFSGKKKLAEEEEKEGEEKENEEETKKEAKKQEEEGGEDETDSKVEERKQNKEENHEENKIMLTQGDRSTPHATSCSSKTSSGGEEGGRRAQGVEGGRINPIPKPPRVRPGPEGRLTDSHTISDESVSQSTPTSQEERSEGVDLKESEGKEVLKNELLKERSEGEEEDGRVKEVRERSEEVREEVKEVKERSEGELNNRPSLDLYPSDLREKEEEEEEKEAEKQEEKEKGEKEEEEEERAQKQEGKEKEEKEEEEEERAKKQERREKEEKEEEEERAQKQEGKEKEKEEEEEEKEKEAQKQEEKEKEEKEEEEKVNNENKKLEKGKGNNQEEKEQEEEDKEEEKEEEEDKHKQQEDKQTYTDLVTKMRLERGFTLDTLVPSSAHSSELPSPNDDAALDSPISPCMHSPSSHSPPNGYRGEKSETWLSDALSDSEEQFERLYNELSKTLNRPTKPQEDEKVESYENAQPDSTLVTPESPPIEKTELQRRHSIIKKDGGQNGSCSSSGKKVQFDLNVKSIAPSPDPILYDVHKAKENGDARPGVTQIREKINKISPQTKPNENARKIEENKRKTTPSPSSPVKKKPQVSAQVKTTRGVTPGEGGLKRRQGLARTSSPVTPPASPTKTVKKTEAEGKGRKTMGEDKTKKTINEDKGKKIEEIKKGGKNEKAEKIKVEDKTKKIEKKEEIRIARKDEKAEEKTEKKEEIRKGERDEEREEKKEKKDETEKDEMKKTEKEDKKENATENKIENIDKKTNEDKTERKMKTEEKEEEKEEEKTTTTTTITKQTSSSSGEVKGSEQRSNVRKQPTVDLQAPLVISGQVEMGGSIGGRLTPRRVEVRDGHLLAFISQASTPSSRLPLAGLSVTPLLGGGGGGGGGASLILSRASRCMMVLKLGSRDEMMQWINTLSDEVLRVTPEEHLRGLTLYPSPEKEEEEEEEEEEKEEKVEEERQSSDDKSANQERRESVIKEEEEKREEEERRKREEEEKKEELTERMKEVKPDEPKNEEDRPIKEGLSLPSKSNQRKQETSVKENGEVARACAPKKTIIKSPNFMEHLNKFREQQKTETQAKKEEEGKKAEERGNRKTGDKQEENRSNKITALIKQVEGRDKEAGREGRREPEGRKERETRETERGGREGGEGGGGGGQLRLKQDKDSPKKTKEEGRTESPTHPPLKRLSGQGKSSPTSPLSSSLTSPLTGEDVVDNYLLVNILPGKATTTTTTTTTRPTTTTTTTKSSTTSKKPPPHTISHHPHHSTSTSNRHANCFKPNNPISSFSRSISTSNTSLAHDEGRKTHTEVLKRSTSDMELNQKKREGGLTRKGAVRVKSTGNRTSRRNSERDSLVDESESMHSARTSVSSVISSRILEAKNVEIIEKEERKGGESEDTEDKENAKWPQEEHKKNINLKLKKEEEGRGGGGGRPGVESNITWSVAATREKFELLCSISGENNKGKLTTKTPIARRRSARMTQKRRRTQELNATTPKRQGTVRKSFVAAENDRAKNEKVGGRPVRRSLIASEGKEEREGKEDMGVRRLGGYGSMTHDEVDDENDQKMTTKRTGSWPTKETVKEARKAFEGYAHRTPTTTTTDEGHDSRILKEKLTVEMSPLTRTLNMIQDSIMSTNEEFRRASQSFSTSNSQSKNDNVVICWKGPYIAQNWSSRLAQKEETPSKEESEQEVLNNISNAFLAKRRLLNKEVALGRLTGRLNLLEEHLWGLQARLATEEEVKGGNRRGVERAIVSVEEEITEVTARLSVLQREALQAREKLEAAVTAGLSQWADKGVLTPKSSLTRRRGRGAEEVEEEEEEETTTEEEVEESEA